MSAERTTGLARHEAAAWVRSQRLAPAAKLVLLIVWEYAGAQEDGRWAAWAGLNTIAEEAGFAEGANGARTVRRHLADMEAAGLIEREERRRANGSQTTSRVVLLIPPDWTDRPDSRDRGGRTVESGGGRTPESGPEAPRGSTTRSTTTEQNGARADAFPDDLPPELHDVAIEAGKVLKRTALTRGQPKPVTRAAVGHAVLTYPDRDHVQVAREVEGWLLHGRGARKSCADVVARYRNFLAHADPRPAPPLAGNVAPMHGRRGRSGQPSVAEILSA